MQDASDISICLNFLADLIIFADKPLFLIIFADKPLFLLIFADKPLFLSDFWIFFGQHKYFVLLQVTTPFLVSLRHSQKEYDILHFWSLHICLTILPTLR